MIEEIRQQALEKARTRIAFLFTDSHSFENHIPIIRAQVMKSLSQSESLLHMTVQNKLDSLKRAVDLMEDSSLKLDGFTSNMKRIDERILQTNSTLSQYKYLKNVNYFSLLAMVMDDMDI